ncbi:MAG: hypothetical protein ACJ75J_15515 [Cytophagaceae bacterium]
MKSLLTSLSLRIFLSIFFGLTVLANGQSFTYKLSPAFFKATNPEKIVLQENGIVYFITKEISGTTSAEKLLLNSMSADGKVTSQKIKFPSIKGADEKDASIISFNGQIIAFVNDNNKATDTRDFYVVEFDKATLLAKPAGKKLASVEKKGGLFSGQSYSYQISPDAKKVSVIETHVVDKKRVGKCYMFDDKFEKTETFDLNEELLANYYPSILYGAALLDYYFYNVWIKDQIGGIYLNNAGELFFVIPGSKTSKSQINVINKSRTVEYVNFNNQNSSLSNTFFQRIGDMICIKSDIMTEDKKTGMYVCRFNLTAKKIGFEYYEKFGPEYTDKYFDRNPGNVRNFNKTSILGMVISESGRTYIFDQTLWTDHLSGDGSMGFHTGNLLITCIDNSGKLVYRKSLLKLGDSYEFDRLAFIPILDGDNLHVLYQDHEENLTTWTTGKIKTPGLKSGVILTDALFDKEGKESHSNTNVYDQKMRLFIRTDMSTFANQRSALLMLFNKNTSEGKFVEVGWKQ